MNTKEKNIIIKQLKSKEIYHNELSEECKSMKDIIDAERKFGLRTIDKIGFDVINQVFFVHEKVLYRSNYSKEEYWQTDQTSFNDFNNYNAYLNGEIYDNACYYQCNDLSFKKITENKSFKSLDSLIDYTIDDYKLTPSEEEIELFNEGEKTKKLIKKWITKFIECDTLEKLQKVVKNYKNSNLSTVYEIDLSFFFWNYIFYDVSDKKRFDVIMQYMSTGHYPEYLMIQPLCHVFNPDEVLLSYNYSNGTRQTCNKHKSKLKKYIESITNSQLKSNETKVFFCPETHYYCEKDSFGVCRYFETFDELISYRGNDLSDADLTKSFNLKYDFSSCTTNNNTKLPLSTSSQYKYVVSKKYKKNIFFVTQTWYNQNNVVIKKNNHSFEYFFDFVAFLKGDLSDANLLLCDGLINLTDVSSINLTNASLTSKICDKFQLDYTKYNLEIKKIESFKETKELEKNTSIVLKSSRQSLSTYDNYDSFNYDPTKERVYYISDIHLMHKLQQKKVKSFDDVLYTINNIVDNIATETDNILLINGDISSDYNIYEIFVKLLYERFKNNRNKPQIIFTLGNHELWDFQDSTFKEIINKYSALLSNYNITLLQNNIVYKNSKNDWNSISSDEIITLSTDQIREKLRDSRITIFGGLGFSGCNEEFNANNGIYRNTLSREQEIIESEKFYKLYTKILESIPDKTPIILTHMPMDCWNNDAKYQNGYIYISGHTHRNYFYDDLETRIYSDNQIGYKNNNIHLKWIDLDNEYDYFSDYEDGIYQISGESYQNFYKGKNIEITFNRKVNILYMLKKNGYYCFIHQAKNKSLSILNGGALKQLSSKDINYYYNNMDTVISTIKDPLEKYTKIQEKISEEIRKIGGVGKIHGCIIDIDFYNHIYVNPVDLKITGYNALNIIYKTIYPNVPALLEKECPVLYLNYNRLISGSSKNLPTISKGTNTNLSLLPQIYLDTDIYKASREIKKMQKLEHSILTTWIESPAKKQLIEQK